MKKEIIISTIIIIAVIIGNIVTQNYTKESVNIMNKELSELKETVQEHREEDTKQKIDIIYQEWEKRQEILSYYIEHNELEKIETQLATLQGNVEGGLDKENFPEIEKCIFILEHIQDKSALNIKNFF